LASSSLELSDDECRLFLRAILESLAGLLLLLLSLLFLRLVSLLLLLCSLLCPRRFLLICLFEELLSELLSLVLSELESSEDEEFVPESDFVTDTGR
jgi:hypothetical protein